MRSKASLTSVGALEFLVTLEAAFYGQKRGSKAKIYDFYSELIRNIKYLSWSDPDHAASDHDDD